MFRSISIPAITAAIAAVAFCSTSFAEVYGYLPQYRCAQDQLKSGDQLQARLDWGWKCYPDKMEDMLWKVKKEDNTFVFPDDKVSRQIYPVFGTVNADNTMSVLQAPIDGSAPCDALSSIVAPDARIRIIGFCGFGCLTPDQFVEFAGGELQIGSAAAQGEANVLTLKEGVRLGALSYKYTPLQQIVQDEVSHPQNIMTFKMVSGNEIRTTENHPLVDAAGELRRADKFNVGDELTKKDGSTERIVNISREKILTKVYNIKTPSAKIEENIYVAQGYLNGSIRIQNELVDYMNRRLLRRGELLNLDGI